jgi:hypothetical protein
VRCWVFGRSPGESGDGDFVFQERRQPLRRPELRHGVELLECSGECVGQAPHCPRLEFFVLRTVSAGITELPGRYCVAEPSVWDVTV